MSFHRHQLYPDEEAKAITCVIASFFMRTDFLGNCKAHETAIKALDAMRKALARTSAAAAGEMSTTFGESAFDLAVCCALARAFGECLEAPCEFRPAAERAMSAIDSTVSADPDKAKALAECLASLDKWFRMVDLLLRSNETERNGPKSERKICAASDLDPTAAGILTSVLGMSVDYACRPAGPFRGAHPLRIGPGRSVEIPDPVKERLGDWRFLILEGREEGVPMVSALSFELVVLCGVRGGAWGRWLGARKGLFRDLAASAFIDLGEKPLVLSEGTFSEGAETLLMGDVPALTLVDAD